MTHKKDHYGQSCLLFEWRGRAGAVYLCFPDKKCPKCHVYEYPTPGDTVFASLLTISANLNQEQKVPQICEQQSRSQHQVVTRSPGHLINNNTALWACGPPATGYWGWILFNKIRLIYSHIWQAHAPCILSTLGQTSCLAPIIPTVHHMHVPVCPCLPPRLLG